MNQCETNNVIFFVSSNFGVADICLNLSGEAPLEGRGVNREGEDRSGHPQRHRDRHQQGHGRKVFLHLLPSQGQGLSDALQIVAKRTLGSGKQLTIRVLPPFPIIFPIRMEHYPGFFLTF